jgi:hypothetical protein
MFILSQSNHPIPSRRPNDQTGRLPRAAKRSNLFEARTSATLTPPPAHPFPLPTMSINNPPPAAPRRPRRRGRRLISPSMQQRQRLFRTGRTPPVHPPDHPIKPPPRRNKASPCASLRRKTASAR